MTTWSILVPVSFSTVRTTNGGPPYSKARLIPCWPWPGMSTCVVRGMEMHVRLVTRLIDMKQHDGVAAPSNVERGVAAVGTNEQIVERIVSLRILHGAFLAVGHLWREIKSAVDVRRHTSVDLVEIDDAAAEQREHQGDDRGGQQAQHYLARPRAFLGRCADAKSGEPIPKLGRSGSVRRLKGEPLEQQLHEVFIDARQRLDRFPHPRDAVFQRHIPAA